MRRKDQWDELAECIVFEDDDFRAGLDRGDDAMLAERIAWAIREHLCIEPPPRIQQRLEKSLAPPPQTEQKPAEPKGGLTTKRER